MSRTLRVCTRQATCNHHIPTTTPQVGVRAQAIWAIGNVAQGLLGPATTTAPTPQPHHQLPAARLCAAALALLQAHPQQEKTASSAIRALGFLAGELEGEDDDHQGLQAACLAALLGAIEGDGGGDGGGGKEEPTARVKTRWNACCALAWVLARLNARGGGREAAFAAPPGVVRTLVHTLMADGNAKVRAHAAAALQAVGHSRGAYVSRRGEAGGGDDQEEQEGGGRGFVGVVEAAVEVERYVLTGVHA